MASTITETVQALLSCVCDALVEDGRPVCSCYQAIGTPVILQCCECEDGTSNGELSVHVRRVFDADQDLIEVQRTRPCSRGMLAAQLRFVLARCRPIIDEHGELPSHEEITDYAEDQVRDIEIMWRALTCCPDGLRIRVDDISVDLSEPGTCSVVYADVTVEIALPKPDSQ